MKTIQFEGKEYHVLDETETHYICPPEYANEGYHWITKTKVEEIKA